MANSSHCERNMAKDIKNIIFTINDIIIFFFVSIFFFTRGRDVSCPADA